MFYFNLVLEVLKSRFKTHKPWVKIILTVICFTTRPILSPLRIPVSAMSRISRIWTRLAAGQHASGWLTNAISIPIKLLGALRRINNHIIYLFIISKNKFKLCLFSLKIYLLPDLVFVIICSWRSNFESSQVRELKKVILNRS